MPSSGYWIFRALRRGNVGLAAAALSAITVAHVEGAEARPGKKPVRVSGGMPLVAFVANRSPVRAPARAAAQLPGLKQSIVSRRGAARRAASPPMPATPPSAVADVAIVAAAPEGSTLPPASAEPPSATEMNA